MKRSVRSSAFCEKGLEVLSGTKHWSELSDTYRPWNNRQKLLRAVYSELRETVHFHRPYDERPFFRSAVLWAASGMREMFSGKHRNWPEDLLTYITHALPDDDLYLVTGDGRGMADLDPTPMSTAPVQRFARTLARQRRSPGYSLPNDLKAVLGRWACLVSDPVVYTELSAALNMTLTQQFYDDSVGLVTIYFREWTNPYREISVPSTVGEVLAEYDGPGTYFRLGNAALPFVCDGNCETTFFMLQPPYLDLYMDVEDLIKFRGGNNTTRHEYRGIYIGDVIVFDGPKKLYYSVTGDGFSVLEERQ